MAQNFQNSGQADKARQRYEQVMKEFPDTLSASIAKKRIGEIDKAGEKK
jgi:TolA-binding protein